MEPQDHAVENKDRVSSGKPRAISKGTSGLFLEEDSTQFVSGGCPDPTAPRGSDSLGKTILEMIKGAERDGDLPSHIGPYPVSERLGAGSMGTVYRAYDQTLSRFVAIKTLSPLLAQEGSYVERFHREARCAARLNHSNITQVFSAGDDEGLPYFVMELIEGVTLAAHIRAHGPLPVAESLRITRSVALGLQEAGKKGIVHRDIKPQNIMLGANGEVKITDFGLARPMKADARLTTVGMVVGTPSFMAPEVVQGARADLRSDAYSLGVTLYTMLAGKPPFLGSSPISVALQHVCEPMPEIAEKRKGLPDAVVALVKRMTALKPGDRFQDYEELLGSLEGALAHLQSRPDRPAEERAAVWLPAGGRIATAVFTRPIVLTVILSALLVLFGGLLYRSKSDRPPGSAPGDPAVVEPLPNEPETSRNVSVAEPGGKEHLTSTGKGGSVELKPGTPRFTDSFAVRRADPGAPSHPYGTASSELLLGGRDELVLRVPVKDDFSVGFALEMQHGPGLGFLLEDLAGRKPYLLVAPSTEALAFVRSKRTALSRSRAARTLDVSAETVRAGGLFSGGFKDRSLLAGGSGVTLPVGRMASIAVVRSRGRLILRIDDNVVVDSPSPFEGPARLHLLLLGGRVRLDSVTVASPP